jgi:hypothetical protein
MLKSSIFWFGGLADFSPPVLCENNLQSTQSRIRVLPKCQEQWLPWWKVPHRFLPRQLGYQVLRQNASAEVETETETEARSMQFRGFGTTGLSRQHIHFSRRQGGQEARMFRLE